WQGLASEGRGKHRANTGAQLDTEGRARWQSKRPTGATCSGTPDRRSEQAVILDVRKTRRGGDGEGSGGRKAGSEGGRCWNPAEPEGLAQTALLTCGGRL
ncbi:unnamed protein product, partial [Gulo gulo]